MQPDIVLQNNPAFSGMATMRGDLAFTCEGHTHRILFITPGLEAKEGATARYPLIVFLQGSGWTSPSQYYQLPQLCSYAQQGFAVASISHRNSQEGHPFPAYLKDAKAAIRFLRSQADDLRIDPDNLAFWGTSSGGNTALLIGLTGDDPRYQTADYEGFSDAVSAVVDCFGPTDLLNYEGAEIPEIIRSNIPLDYEKMVSPAMLESNAFLAAILALLGKQKPIDVLRGMSPLYEVQDQKAYPPFLIAQGDMDTVVPFSQSERIHKRLLEAGANSTLVKVTGAEHEGSFWSEEMHALILRFIKEHLAG
ncbi:MAG: alpha/beta hydrolase [Clostridiales bacterium]|nr:alpha/beta hydrolase [Clostridiales bacterium]